MRVEVVMPQMGESIVEGTVVEWLKAVGDAVEADEDIFTLSTDKVDAEVPSPANGVLVEILANPGDTVEVGAVVAYVETDASAAKGVAAATAAATPEKTPAAAEPLTSPEPAGVPAAVASTASAPTPAPPADDTPIAELTKDELRRRRSTPLVRRIADKHGISDLGAVVGTGVSGRVTKKDILAFIAAGGPATVAQPTVAATTPAATASAVGAPEGYLPAWVKPPRVHVYDNDRVEPMTRMRASISENMVQARRGTAHCHTVWEADVSRIIKDRAAQKAEFAERGVKLTYTAYFVAAVAEALREFPVMNAAITQDSIVYRGSINIGVAAAIDEGLIVPVLKAADGLNLFGIARGVNDLGDRSRNKKLKPADVADGTFTISNSGIWGSEFGVPILVQPQVGILGIGGIKKRVRVLDDDSMAIRSVVRMCLTFDHRLIDGATADGFMSYLTKRIGNWE